MKFFRNYLGIAFTLCVLALFAGCASPLQQANKLAISDPQSAITAYEQVIASKPGSPEAQQAHLGLAKTYYERIEDHQKGLEAYEAVVSKYPKTEVAGKANYAIGWHYFNAKDYEKAREKFAIVTKEMPGTEESGNAALAIARSYEELKKYDEAADLYKEFAASHPKHKYAPQAGLSAAKSYEQAGKNDEAVEAYKAVVKDHSISSSGREAQDALTNMGIDTSELIQLPETETEPAQPSTIGVRSRRRRATNAPRDDLGRVIEQGEGAEGEGGQQRASRSVSPDFGVDPADIMPPGMTGDAQGTMYDAMLMMANMSLQSKEYNNAGALYERAIQSAGNKTWKSAPSAYFGLAKSYKGIGNDEKAAEMFRKAISLDRKIIDRMILSGETAYGDEEYDEAIKAYETALGLAAHKDAEIYYNLGLVYLKLKDPDKELEAFERAVALKPNFAEAVQHLAEVLYYRKKDATRAEIYDKEARGQGNTDYRIQKELGDLSYKYGAAFSKEEDRERQSDSCYSWSKIKHGNAARLAKNGIEAQLKNIIAAGDEAEAKQITPGDEKITLKLVSDSAAAGNPLALEALQKSADLLAEYRHIGSRIVIAQARLKRDKDAQKQIDKLKADDPNIADSADFHLALGEFALLQGNKDVGLSEIKKALEINPEHKEASEKLKEVEGQGTAEATSAEAAG
ncbi:tetratricopeptide repeat protein [Candidatus Poribacteria bacterium]